MKRIAFAAMCLFLGACGADKMKWVAVGDSITYLNDHQNETGERVRKGYMTRVVEQLPHLEYINKGFNGWTATDVAGQIDNLDLHSADLYTVFLGTNDWWRGVPIGTPRDFTNNTGNTTVYGAFRIIIDKLRDLNAAAPVILITPMQRVDFVYIADMKNNAYGSYKDKNGQQLSEFADAIVAIGKLENLEVIDLYHQSGMNHENLVRFKRLKDPGTGDYRNFSYPDYIDIPFDPETDEYPYPPDAVQMTYDGLHPSDEGYQIIASMLIDKLSD